MPRVRLYDDPLDLSSSTEHCPDSLLDFLADRFPTWPPTARLYKGAVAVENDVTPACEGQVEQLRAAGPDELYSVVVYPAGPIAIAMIVVGVLVVAAMMLLMPKIPGQGSMPESANNSLGARANKARPGGRIADIFGQVISIPELLTVPLLQFENNLEVETCYMAVGRGAYDVADMKDGDTPLVLIAGAGATIYGPNTSPNSGAPQASVGVAVTAPLLDVIKLNEVNGQILDAPNANAVHGNGDIRFVAPNAIQTNNPALDFTKSFGTGDELAVASANFGGSVAVYDATTQQARFYPNGRIEFQSFDPRTMYSAGETLVVSNAGFAGSNAGGQVVYVDVSGTYVIASVTATEVFLELT